MKKTMKDDCNHPGGGKNFMKSKQWVTSGFEAFRRGAFGNGGQNLYVSKKGVLQRIFQYDLDRRFLDLQ